MALIDIASLFLDELKEHFKALGEPAYRASQVYTWLAKGANSFDEMSNISKTLRDKLSSKFYIATTAIEKCLASRLDGTKKYLFRLFDGEFIEAVLMKYHHGYTVCISTQVGCKMGCTFCATGKTGFSRNLTASEMLSQIKTIEKDNNIRVSNVVLMGMGEPLDNYSNVVRFLKLVSSSDNLNIGMRHISLSTCGLVNKIYDLAKEKFQLTLSVSLHAPNDEIRSRTMPINRRYNVDELLKACRHYAEQTGRRISFEYAMISGVNDTRECALELAQKLKGMLCHVNLIPLNDNKLEGVDYKKSTDNNIKQFVEILTKKGIAVTVRRTLGKDINASCGQLRRKTIKSEVNICENMCENRQGNG